MSLKIIKFPSTGFVLKCPPQGSGIEGLAIKAVFQGGAAASIGEFLIQQRCGTRKVRPGQRKWVARGKPWTGIFCSWPGPLCVSLYYLASLGAMTFSHQAFLHCVPVWFQTHKVESADHGLKPPKLYAKLNVSLLKLTSLGISSQWWKANTFFLMFSPVVFFMKAPAPPCVS